MTVLYLWQKHKSLSCRFPLICPWERCLFISIFFYLFPPSSSRSSSRSLSLLAFVTDSVNVCAVPGSCWVCVLSLSLVSTHSSHCPYLKWPEPHQQIKSQVPPAHSAPSPGRSTLHTVWRWDAQQAGICVSPWKKHYIKTHLLTTMPMGGGGCLSPQHTSGVSGVNSVRAESKTIEVTGDQSFRHNKTT